LAGPGDPPAPAEPVEELSNFSVRLLEREFRTAVNPAVSSFAQNEELAKLRQSVANTQEMLDEDEEEGPPPALCQVRLKLEDTVRKFRSRDPAEVAAVLNKEMWTFAKAELYDEAERCQRDLRLVRRQMPKFALAGLWKGEYPNHGDVTVRLRYRGGDQIYATKVAGGGHVPVGEVTFSADVSDDKFLENGRKPDLGLAETVEKQIRRNALKLDEPQLPISQCLAMSFPEVGEAPRRLGSPASFPLENFFEDMSKMEKKMRKEMERSDSDGFRAIRREQKEKRRKRRERRRAEEKRERALFFSRESREDPKGPSLAREERGRNNAWDTLSDSISKGDIDRHIDTDQQAHREMPPRREERDRRDALHNRGSPGPGDREFPSTKDDFTVQCFSNDGGEVEQFPGEGRVARSGFRDANFVPGRLFILDDDTISFIWLPLGTVVVFKRVEDRGEEFDGSLRTSTPQPAVADKTQRAKTATATTQQDQTVSIADSLDDIIKNAGKTGIFNTEL
jgi:hypothetical protein